MNDCGAREVNGCYLLPLKTQCRGPAPPAPADQEDIIDEIITFFRANVLHANFEVEGPADRVLIVGTLMVQQAIKKCMRHQTREAGQRELHSLSISAVCMPGESTWPLGAMIGPGSMEENETLKGYFKQMREEIGLRMLELLYPNGGPLNKWWAYFGKRTFMGKQFR